MHAGLALLLLLLLFLLVYVASSNDDELLLYGHICEGILGDSSLDRAMSMSSTIGSTLIYGSSQSMGAGLRCDVLFRP